MLSSVLTVLRVAALIFSFYGLFQFTLTKLSVNVDFVIPLIFAAIGSALFLGGLLYILPVVAVLILLSGIVFGIMSIIRRESFFRVVSAGTVFFAVVAAVLVYTTYGARIVSYDDFSHWAIVMRPLVNNNRFPIDSDHGILFTSYPLGSSCVYYYFAFITGIKTEWIYMYAKSVLITGLFTSLFAFSRKWVTYLLAGASSLIFLTGNNAILSLSVDTLMPAAGAAGFLFCVYYRKQILEKIWLVLPFTIFAINVKNSGVFFAAAIVGYMLLCGHDTLKENKRKWIINAAAPFAALILWQIHVKLTFSNGMRSKHSMSLYYFAATVYQKSFRDIWGIIKSIFFRFFSLSNKALYLAAFVLILYAVMWLLQKKKGDSETKTDLYMLVALFAYELGLIGTFLFSMPLSEAVALSGYERYYRSMLIFIAAFICVRTIIFIDGLSKKALEQVVCGAVAVLCALSFYFTLEPYFGYFRRQYPGGLRYDIERIIEEYDLQPNKKYLLTRTGPDFGDTEFPFHYLLQPDVAGSSSAEELRTEDYMTYFDYLVVVQRDEEIDAYLEETFGTSDVEVIDLSQYR